MSDPASRAVDAGTSGEALAAIAYEHPELRALVARHPAAYPSLLAWIAEHGDDAARATVAARTASSGAPLERRSRRGVALGVAGAAVAAAAAVVVTLLVVSSLTPSSGPAAATSTDAATATPSPTRETVQPLLVAELTKLPIAPVTVTIDTGYDATAVQRFANDVAAGDMEALVRKCWTFAPDTVRDRYASEAGRGAVLDALSNLGVLGQYGAVWTGSVVDLYFSWPELQSSYACPQVRILGVDDVYGPVDAAWLVHRLAGRASGTPVAPGDVAGGSYYLYCGGDVVDDWPFTADGVAPVQIDDGPVSAAAIALDGHPIQLSPLEYNGYYEVWSPDVDVSIVVQGYAGVACAGEAR